MRAGAAPAAAALGLVAPLSPGALLLFRRLVRLATVHPEAAIDPGATVIEPTAVAACTPVWEGFVADGAASEAEWSGLSYADPRTTASGAAPGATFIGRMDNLAHTLVGAALGRAVADRKVAGAALLGALAGNAPDWSELLVSPRALAPPSEPHSSYLLYHRGITHSLLGAAVEIAALGALAGLALRWHARRTGARPAPWRWIAALVGATVASHLYLDWQGSYGLRPFLPWSGRWYYADWIAIVDPFFWIVPLVALAWGARRQWLPALGFLLVLLGITALVVWARGPIVAPWVRFGVLAGGVMCVVGWMRHWFGVARRREAAAYAMLVLAAYVAANAAVSVWVKAPVRATAIRRFGPEARWAALTQVGHPFRWEPVYAGRDTVAGRDWAVPRHLTHPAVVRALTTPAGRSIAQFARFLAAEVDSSGSGLRVYLRDARYHPAGPGGWAAVEVRLR